MRGENMTRKNCYLCKKNLRTLGHTNQKTGKKYYRKYCRSCYIKKNRKELRKTKCDFCGFIPVHICQLDLDHIDGNHKNNKEDNLQTLCANCHRLKTYLNKDWRPLSN